MSEQSSTLYVADGKVVLDFPAIDSLVTLQPGDAARLGTALMAAAADLGIEIQVPVEHKGISDQHRMRLYTRAGHIIRSMQNKTPAQIGVHVVDEVLKEVI